MKNIKNWSLGESKPPRHEQIEIISETQEALDSDYKNIIWECGTGIGKSAMATTTALNNSNAYILTMTKQLQQQYVNDFSNYLKQIKGRNSYSCLYDMEVMCDKSQCLNSKKLKLMDYEIGDYKRFCKLRRVSEKGTLYSSLEDEFELLQSQFSNRGWDYGKDPCYRCLYRTALKEARAAKVTLTNYDYLYFAGNYSHQLLPRNLLILDEAHNLETKIMNLVSESLSRRQIFKDLNYDIFYPIANGDMTLKALEEQEFWIDQLEYIIEEYKSIRYYYFEEGSLTEKKANEIDNKCLRYEEVINYLKDEENRWIIELPKKKEILKDKIVDGRYGANFNGKLSVDFKPLYISDYSDQLLDFGNQRLFMTGTLGDLSDFCRWNGLDESETYYIYRKSPFKVANRPIYRAYAGSMTRNNYEDTLPRAKRMVREILDKYPEDKGVIHVSSYKQAQDIEGLSDRILVHDNTNREATIHMFERSEEPWVLVSPSIKDGVDFKDDKCRFQIIFKMPYPSLASKQTNIKVHHDQRWYNYNTVMPLMQAYGRGIRNEDDYCDVYILDSEFSRLYSQNEDLFNEYFKEALITVPRQKGLDSIVPAGAKVKAPVMKEVKVPVQMTFSVDGGLNVGK